MREALGADPPGLLERLRAGEPRAFEELVTVYQHRVFGVALRMLGSRAEAEEIAQEVFLRAYRALADFRGDARLGTWLYGIASRLCLNRLASPDRRVARGDAALADVPAATPAERAALDAHLAGCADCRRELAGLLRTVKLVRAIDPSRAPAGFVDRVLAAARPDPAPKRLARRRLAPWQTLPLGAAALFLIAGLAVLLFRGSPEQQQAARYQPTIPGPTAQAPTREIAPSTGPTAPTAAPRETGSPAPTATRETAPPAPPPPPRHPQTAKNRGQQPAPAEPRARRTAQRGSPP